jgi:hypothetical protein
MSLDLHTMRLRTEGAASTPWQDAGAFGDRAERPRQLPGLGNRCHWIL